MVAEPEAELLVVLEVCFCIFLGTIAYVYMYCIYHHSRLTEKAAKREKAVFQYTT